MGKQTRRHTPEQAINAHTISTPVGDIADPDIPLDVVTDAGRQPLGDGEQLVLSNSFGFGGHNAVAAFRSV